MCVCSKRLKRNSPKQWLFNLTGDVIDIDMDEADGIELSRSVSSDNEQQLDRDEAPGDIYESSSSVIETQQSFRSGSGWMRERFETDEDATGYFYDSAWTASKIYSEFQSKLK